MPGAPYFITDKGESWTPVGQNDAITWPDMKGLFGRKDQAGVEGYFQVLAANGITCIRLMLEYCQTEHRYLERPAGQFQQKMVELWDDIFMLCEKYRIRILLTPFDTFWMKRRWQHHPYNQRIGGPCARRSHWILCKETRTAIKNRLAFATERWGGSGALFAWDLWNEIQPSHGGHHVNGFHDFINDVGGFLKAKETGLFGRAHLQTVSFFGHRLAHDPLVSASAFRHPALDFSTLHFYEHPSIDAPRNTVDAAITIGRLTRAALTEINDGRPFFDSEHGPIYSFNTRRKTLPEAFDDEYFRHMQWAHFASGGAGGGMRWPYRHPHTLTTGMRAAQRALTAFLPLVRFDVFCRKNLNEEIVISDKAFVAFACGDGEQAIIWLLRQDQVRKKSAPGTSLTPISLTVQIPSMKKGNYTATAWDTVSGQIAWVQQIRHDNDLRLSITVSSIAADLALALTKNSNLCGWKQGVLFGTME